MRLFFLDYNKEGPGVQKNAPPQKGLKLFVDIFMREFTSLIKLNLLFIVSCIPIITIGPAIGAMTSVTIKMIQDMPTDLYYDFKEAFKRNWKASFLSGVLTVAFMLLLWLALACCVSSEGVIFNIAISIILVVMVILGTSYIYIYPMIVKVNLPLRIVFNNAVLLGISRVKHSLPTFLLCVGILEGSIIFCPFTLPIILLFTFSFISFITSFCAWNGIKRFIIQDINVADQQV